MAIVKMKKLKLMVATPQREELLRELILLKGALSKGIWQS